MKSSLMMFTLMTLGGCSVKPATVDGRLAVNTSSETQPLALDSGARATTLPEPASQPAAPAMAAPKWGVVTTSKYNTEVVLVPADPKFSNQPYRWATRLIEEHLWEIVITADDRRFDRTIVRCGQKYRTWDEVKESARLLKQQASEGSGDGTKLTPVVTANRTEISKILLSWSWAIAGGSCQVYSPHTSNLKRLDEKETDEEVSNRARDTATKMATEFIAQLAEAELTFYAPVFTNRPPEFGAPPD